MSTFEINGKKYQMKPFTYNFVCDLEDVGITLEEIDKRPMKLGREYLAFCGGVSSEFAGEEIERHIINGGDISVLYDALSTAINESDFFQSMTVSTETKKEEKK